MRRQVRVALVVGRDRPDRDGVAAYVHRLVAALPASVQADVVEWPGLSRWSPDGYDLVHVQFAPSAYGYSGGIGLLPLRAHRPVVTTLHEYGWWAWQPRLAPLWSAGERLRVWDRETLRLVPASRRIVVTGPTAAAAVQARLGRTAEVVPIGANVEVSWPGTRAQARAALGLPLDVPVLAFFGFVHPVKGLRHLVDAVAALRARWPGLRLLVVGGWRSLAWPDADADGFADEVRAYAAARGLADAVTLTGYLADAEVSLRLVAADVAVLPFTHGLTAKSGSLLTCWAHGLPVVATEPPDGPDPAVGAAVEPARVRDSATLAVAVERVLADPVLASRLVASGRARVAERDWSVIAGRHARLYGQALGDG